MYLFKMKIFKIKGKNFLECDNYVEINNYEKRTP